MEIIPLSLFYIPHTVRPNFCVFVFCWYMFTYDMAAVSDNWPSIPMGIPCWGWLIMNSQFVCNLYMSSQKLFLHISSTQLYFQVCSSCTCPTEIDNALNSNFQHWFHWSKFAGCQVHPSIAWKRKRKKLLKVRASTKYCSTKYHL